MALIGTSLRKVSSMEIKLLSVIGGEELVVAGADSGDDLKFPPLLLEGDGSCMQIRFTVGFCLQISSDLNSTILACIVSIGFSCVFFFLIKF